MGGAATKPLSADNTVLSVDEATTAFNDQVMGLSKDGAVDRTELCAALRKAANALADQADAVFSTREMLEELGKYGLVRGDPRLQYLINACEKEGFLSASEFASYCDKSILIQRAMGGGLIIPDFPALCADFQEIYEEVLPIRDGANADYIPQLSEKHVNPDQFGVSLCTIDGQRWHIGDADARFGIQSCSKAISYCIAQSLHGADVVHRHVGMEPSGRPFNEMCLDERAHHVDVAKMQFMSKEETASFHPRPPIPHNPMINAGAIMIASMLFRDQPLADRFDSVMKFWKDLVGCDDDSHASECPSFANSMCLSESATADRNFCLGHMMKEEGAFMPDTDLAESLQLYFMCCSITMSAKMMAVVAATLANGGVNPISGKRVFKQSTVRNTLSLMASCGMYDYSGEFAFTMGFPAKSGVGGAILIVIPGVMGVCTFSPRLDDIGNSTRGVAFCHAMAARFAFHNFASLTEGSLKDPTRLRDVATTEQNVRKLLWAVADNNRLLVQQLLLQGVDVNAADYDGRTALHLAACIGADDMIRYLLTVGADPAAVDRFGCTPVKDAVRGNNAAAVAVLAPVQDAVSMKGKNMRLVALGSADGKTILVETVVNHVKAVGISDTDDRIVGAFAHHGPVLDASTFDAIFDSCSIVRRALCGQLVLKDFQSLKERVGRLHAEVQDNTGGQNADYIPILADVDPNKWGVALCSVDGQRMSFGDSTDKFCVQSCSKAITYCIAVEENGAETIRHHIGREPSGRPFNEAVLDRRVSPAVPHNPCVNAGAIMACALVQNELDDEARVQHCMQKYWARLAGSRDASAEWYDPSIYESESKTANRNRCLTYLMAESGTFPANMESPAELMQNLEFYFKCCSIMQDAESMSIIAGALANGGVCPVTDERIFKEDTVRDCLSLLYSCGMYDYSGEFAFRIGFPAKSGVGGALMVIIPNRLGICTWSPPLDANGNSVRGVDFCTRLAEFFNFHIYDRMPTPEPKYDPSYNGGGDFNLQLGIFIEAASKNDLHAIHHLDAMHGDSLLTTGDYDQRTALHLASAEGHIDVVKFILGRNARTVDAVDRWGSRPIDDARRANHAEVVVLLQAATDEA